MDWTHFTDVILAGVIIITCIILVAYGHDGVIKTVLGVSTAWLFGKSAYAMGQNNTNGKNGGSNAQQS